MPAPKKVQPNQATQVGTKGAKAGQIDRNPTVRQTGPVGARTGARAGSPPVTARKGAVIGARLGVPPPPKVTPGPRRQVPIPKVVQGANLGTYIGVYEKPRKVK
jgi:hypothetical protein